MRIEIDSSEIIYEHTGVSRYVTSLVHALVTHYPEHEYILFGASLRRRFVFQEFVKTLPGRNVRLVCIPAPQTVLAWLWNTMHIISPELVTGPIDIFWFSDWTQTPLQRAKAVTTVHDVNFLKVNGCFDDHTVTMLTKRLSWVIRECDAILCDSDATRRDLLSLYDISEKKLSVVYPGYRV